MKKLFGMAALAFLLVPANAMAATMTAQVTVNTDSNLGGTGCQLRDAISAVSTDNPVFNCTPVATTDPTDTVTFAPALSGATINLDQGEISLGTGDGLNVMGPGMGSLTVDADTGARVFNVPGADTVTVSGMTVQGGAPNAVAGAIRGGCIFKGTSATLTLNSVRVTDCEAIETNTVDVFSDGGAIGANGGGQLTLNNSLVDNNRTRATNTAGNATSASARGTIYSEGPLTLNNTTISGNEGSASDDGTGSATGFAGVDENGLLNVSRSTISGNTASAEEASGQAIAVGALHLINFGGAIELSTLAGNVADTTPAMGVNTIGAGGIFTQLNANTLAIRSSTIAQNGPTSTMDIDGVGLYTANAGTINVSNSIFADPRGNGFNCVNSGSGGATAINTLGYNVDYSPDGGSTSTCFTSPLATDMTSNPLLGSLGNNGGPTQTVPLSPTSPAIDAGLNAGITLSPATQDQRGLTRPVDFSGLTNAAGGNGTDIGAFEVQQACPPFVQATPTTPCPPPPPSGGGGTATTPAATGQRSAALKKCKKKKSKQKRKKCKKKANQLPV